MKHISKFQISLVIILSIVCHSFSFCQQTEKPFKQRDVFSIFVKKENQQRRDSLKSLPPLTYKAYIALTPFIGYNPAYGLLVGVGTTIGMYLGDPLYTPISSASAVINITAKSQKIFNLRTNLITDQSRIIMRGDWRYMIFSQPTYGLGSGIKHSNDKGVIFSYGEEGNDEVPEEQPLNYNYIRLYETFYFNIIKKWYVGLGYCLDDYRKIVDKKLNTDTINTFITSHYKYSLDHGFNPAKYSVSGISVEVLLDSRNNTIRPTRGFLANVALRPNFTFLGSTKNSIMLNTEFRTYISFSKRRPDHLIAFWYLGQFTEKGNVPYLALPALGWDMYNRAGRGYVQGSIRGVNFLYGETEYRFPISLNTGILGGVAFINVTTASGDDHQRQLFESFDPAMGAGLRVMFSRKTLSNLCIDLGFGADGTIGVFFNLNEGF